MFMAAYGVFPQNFPIGHSTVYFIDPARGNRQIPVEIYYPGVTAGSNVVVANGKFPVISFGHGFMMTYNSYLYLKDSLVPLGYIIAFANSETGLLPSHLEFGKDLAFVLNQMKVEGTNPSSAYYNHIDSTSAIMGHSMGGGASFLACENNTVPTVLVTLAAAETNPSAIAAASHIAIPSLVFSADEDCVTPPATNQIPMYDSLQSSCKVFLNIKGGGHCYFADYNLACSIGEASCSTMIEISRDQQHAAVIDFLVPYLDYYLKNIPLAWTIFNDSLQNSQRITFMKSCTTTGLNLLPADERFRVSPNPVHDQLTLTYGNEKEKLSKIVLRSLTGVVLFSRQDNNLHGQATTEMDLSCFPAGAYLLEVTGRTGIISVLRVIKL